MYRNHHKRCISYPENNEICHRSIGHQNGKKIARKKKKSVINQLVIHGNENETLNSEKKTQSLDDE